MDQDNQSQNPQVPGQDQGSQPFPPAPDANGGAGQPGADTGVPADPLGGQSPSVGGDAGAGDAPASQPSDNGQGVLSVDPQPDETGDVPPSGDAPDSTPPAPSAGV